MKLENMKIRAKLYGAFGVIVFLMVIVGLVSTFKLGGLQANIVDITTDKYPKTQWATDVQGGLYQVEIIIRDCILSENHDEVVKGLEKIDLLVKTVASDRMDLFKKHVKTEKGKELLNQFADARAKYRVDFLNVLTALKRAISRKPV
jgi:hypothetical protein